jgi:hypothetical protein
MNKHMSKVKVVDLIQLTDLYFDCEIKDQSILGTLSSEVSKKVK